MEDRAVVLGAGFAGLLAAAVLTERFSSITVVERDRLPDKAVPRRGVPQGRHLHSLLSRGSQALDEILPGFLAELHSAGAMTSWSRLMRVTNLIDPPQRLLDPPLLARVLTHHTRRSLTRRLER